MKAAKNNTKVTKEITQKQKNRQLTIKLIFISIVLTLLVFIALLVLQSNILDKEETAFVVTAKKDIITGTKITEDNINDYLEISERTLATLPDGYITSADEVLNKFVEKDYKIKEVITSDVLKDRVYSIDDIKNPIEVSFSIGSLPNAVSGILREGDKVNLYSTVQVQNTENDGSHIESNPIMLGAYISKAFTSGGEEISTDDNTTAATMFNVVISEEVEPEFNIAISDGSLRLSKILYDSDETESNQTENQDSVEENEENESKEE